MDVLAELVHKAGHGAGLLRRESRSAVFLVEETERRLVVRATEHRRHWSVGWKALHRRSVGEIGLLAAKGVGSDP